MCSRVNIYIYIYRYILICVDSIFLDIETIPESAKKYFNPLLYKRPIIMRILIGNTIPVIYIYIY